MKMKEMHMLREFGTPRHWKEIFAKFSIKSILFIYSFQDFFKKTPSFIYRSNKIFWLKYIKK